MSSNVSRLHEANHWLRRSSLSLLTLFAVCLSGWAQSAQLFTLGPESCEGEQVNVITIVDFDEPFAWELQFGGLAPDISGEDSELQANYDVLASNAGLYDFELTVIGVDTTFSDTWPVEIVTGTAFGNLTLANAALDLEEVVEDDGSILFRSCSGDVLTTMDFDISFSGGANTVTSWIIDWGDGTSSTQNDAVGSIISHDYEPGSWAMTFEVQSSSSGTSGIQCGQTTPYQVFVGTEPQVNLTVADVELCLNNPVGEIILSNQGLTEVAWEIEFSDGSLAENDSTDAANTSSFSHAFSSSSCGEVIQTPSGDVSDVFSFTAVASNACGVDSFINEAFFEVSVPPMLAIAAEPASAVCPDEVVTLTNASTTPNLTTENGCTGNHTFFWKLDPAVTLLSGDLGADNGFPDQPEFWVSGGDQIEVTSNVLGSHEIALISHTNAGCGGDTLTYALIVSEPGVLTLDLPNQLACSGTPVQDFTFGVSPDEYAITWTVLDADSNAVAPGDFEGIDMVTGTGVDTVSFSNNWTLTNTSTSNLTVLVQATVPCAASDPLIHEINVQGVPVIEATPSAQTICSGETTNISLSVNTGEDLSWTTDAVGGDVTFSATAASGTSIQDTLTNTGTTVGVVTYTIDITAPNCPGTPGNAGVVEVTVLPGLPDPNIEDVSGLCPGEAVAETPLPDIETVEWAWENSNSTIGLPADGQGDVPGWTATNPSTEVMDAVVVLIGQAGDCEPEEAGSFNVSVLPTPQAEVEVSSNGNLSCIDGKAVIALDFLTEDTEVDSIEGGSILTVDILDSVVVDSAATYIMTLLSIGGCEATQEVVVNPLDDILISDVIALNPLCFEEPSGVIEVFTDELGPVDYDWSGPSAASGSFAKDLLAGEYVVIVTNEAGCQDSSSVTLSDPDELAISLLTLPSECGEANGFLFAQASGGTGQLTHTWLDADSVMLDGGTLELGGIEEGMYSLQSVDANGCVSETIVNLECIPLLKPIPAQFISPNGDGKNDRWTIDNIDKFPNAVIRVFNRWGVEVFKVEGEYLQDWEGTNQDGKPLPSATYFYVIDTKKKSQRPFNGYLELQTYQP